MGPGGQAGGGHAPDRLDLGRRHFGPPLPALTEDGDQTARLAHLDVAPLVEGVVQEDVAGEHRHRGQPALTSLPCPHLQRRQEDREALGGQLIGHELLAVAAGPQDVPDRGASGGDNVGRRRQQHDVFLSDQMRPMRRAAATISVRECTSSAAQIFSRWSLTVWGLRCTRPPICLLVRPRARWRRMSMSMSDRASVFLTRWWPRSSPLPVAAAMTWGATMGSNTDSPR